MHGVVKSLAQAGARHGVRAVCIAPGPVLTRPGMANVKTLEGRAAEPEELVDMILYAASEKGSIDTIPEIPGLAVWHKGHIGIYIGNGEVIEAMGSRYGVVKPFSQTAPGPTGSRFRGSDT